jgi:formate hydrogenlyase subunit 6/NADH:ubiquinone oxidoreductase subunit I
MMNMLANSLRRGTVTAKYPAAHEAAPLKFRGKPVIDAGKCDACSKCADACPSKSIKVENKSIAVCIGNCVFCGACLDSCPKGAVTHSQAFELSSKDREGLYEKYEAEAK